MNHCWEVSFSPSLPMYLFEVKNDVSEKGIKKL
jgi:hypothetical protein